MAFEVPTDLIRQVQSALRNNAGLSSYDPYDPTLPPLPSLAASIAGLDPSPPYLRCKHCKGRLLSGIQSLICVYCGKQQKRDIPPEPIAFNSTFGYRLLLESLGLDGSETIGPPIEESESHRGQSAPKDEISLSKLLDLHIPWSDEPEKIETNATNKKLKESESSVTLIGVDLDNYFSGSNSDTLFSASEEQPVISKQSESTERKEVAGQANLNLFQNVPPSVTDFTASKDASGDALSEWEASFQSADTGNRHESSKSADPFIGSTVDLSAHIDSIFGGGEDLKDGKPNEDPVPPPSMVNNWPQDDMWNNVNSAVSQPFDSAAKDKDGSSLDIVNNTSSESVDWFQDNQWQTNIASVPKDNNVNSAVSQQFDLAGKDKDGQSLDSSNNPSSESVDWFQDNQWQTNISSIHKDNNDNSAVSQQFEQLDSAVKDKDGRSLDRSNNPSSESVDWFQDNQRQTNIASVPKDNNVNSAVSQQFDSAGKDKDGRSLDSYNQSSESVDWFLDNQWQTNITSVPKDKMVNEDDDSFDEWNDFTSSSNAQVPSSSAAVNEQTSETNMLNSVSNFQGVDFGSFAQVDPFSGSSSHQNDSAEFNNVMSEGPTSDRTADSKSEVEENTEQAAENVEDSNTTSQPMDDVDILMSQMHDLSFMLDSNLSVPPKLDGLGSFSHD